jgi:copper ion binding protein
MTTATRRTFAVPDISCEHCVKAITDHVSPVEGVEEVEVDLDAKTVTVVGGDDASIVAAIDDAGYDVA